MKKKPFRKLIEIIHNIVIVSLLLLQSNTGANAQSIAINNSNVIDTSSSETNRSNKENQPNRELLETLPDDFLQLPFAVGNPKFLFFNGVHGTNNSGIDISISYPFPDWGKDTTNNKIVAPAPGIVRQSYNKPKCEIFIDFENGWAVRFVHVSNILKKDGNRIKRNEPIATMAVTQSEATCLSGSSATKQHLHLTLLYYGTGSLNVNNPTSQVKDLKNTVWSGWKINYNTPGYYGDTNLKNLETGETISRGGKVQNPGIKCPQGATSLTLYNGVNFSCENEREGIGYKVYDNLIDKQILQVPAGLPASSIRIPAGWYAVLRGINNEIALRCQSDKSFSQDSFNTSLPLNDKVTSIEMHQGACTETVPPNDPPNAPAPLLPTENTNAIDIAPNLTWKNMGDPNGDELQFYVEVIGSNRTLTKDWSNDTTWRPAGFDHQYDGYQWRVKARDVRGMESDWSKTWIFSIQPPDDYIPMSVDFLAANNDPFSSGTIYSNDTTWSFVGTASSPRGILDRIEWRCSGDGCNTTQAIANGTSSWNYTQENLSGRNDIYFRAYDVSGFSMPSRSLDLRIDLAAPTTTLALDGNMSESGWFLGAVNVSLKAKDNYTGDALAGMGKIHYQLDNGGWQVVSGSNVIFTIGEDGVHTIDYYSEDTLGNTEAQKSFTIKVDQAPPSLPANLQEEHGLVSNAWQNFQNTPSFIWSPATDTTSGVRGYRMCFTAKPDGEDNCKKISAFEPYQLTPLPNGVPTGTYYLRARTQDVAGNWSAWATLFTFRYDNTPPENPANVIHATDINADWQNKTSQADFSWPAAHDEGSGNDGYYIYWGTSSTGTSTTFIRENSYQDLQPLCTTDAACTGYLRVRSLDKVGNLAEDWSTVFILRYDNAHPQVDFTFNGGASETSQSLVTLNVDASDLGSGVYAARFSSDGHNWTEWEKPSVERLWQIPAISRQSWPVYAQVTDGVGLLSEIISHEIYFDANPGQPNSSNYRLFDYVPSAGSGAHASDNYSARGTLGQVSDSPASSSTQYTLWNGYEAASQAIPLETPGYDHYGFPLGIFASGVLAPPLQSAQYQLMFGSGGIGLPTETTIGSAGYLHQPGFLAAVRPEAVIPPSAIQPKMPPPDPKPELSCDAPQVLINDGALYTVTATVTLRLCAPLAVEMIVSERDDFADASWQPFAPSLSWTISTAGSAVEPRFVYARFKDASGKVHTTYFDDILYDAHRPSGELLLSDDIPLQTGTAGEMGDMKPSVELGDTGSAITLQAAGDGSVALFVDGFDDNSGLSNIQLSEDIAFADAEWQPFSPVVNYTPQGEDGLKTVYARFQDDAGNISGVTALQFIYDTQAPLGYLYADPSVLAADAVTTTLYFGDYDYWEEYWDDEEEPGYLLDEPTFEGGATELRFGLDPNLIDAFWQPFIESVEVPIDSTQAEVTFYVQYRDAAGNISEIVDTTYYIDSFAPNLTVSAEPGEGDVRVLNIYADDDLSGIAQLHLSNDPLMQENVIIEPYTSTLTWTFDERRVVWVVAEDGVGNISEPYPVFATDLLYMISGNAGASGVTLSYIDGEEKAVTSNDEGFYVIVVPPGWSGTVTPFKTGYVFEPAIRSYEALTDNFIEQSYVATPPSGDFGKTAPTDGATSVPLSPTLEWAAHEGATSYEYCYSSAPGPCTKWNSVGTNTSVTLSGLAPNTTYYWQVRASSPGGTIEADAGTWWSFGTTADPVNTWPPYTPPGVATFADVPSSHWAWNWIERLYSAGITGGCSSSPLSYCPEQSVTRAQMAIFLLRGIHGSSYTPPLVGDGTGFTDVPVSYWASAWIKQFYAEGITGGCGNGGYCPDQSVTRAQMAIFLLRAKHGSNYAPPAVSSTTGFGDVAVDYWAASWIKQLAAEGITGGCGNDNYCPEEPVTRTQMAIFLVRAFGLP